MIVFEDCLLEVADAYAKRVEDVGGKSLARVATIAVNNGSFFDLLRGGQTCFVRNLRRAAAYFERPEHWPEGHIPAEAAELLRALGSRADFTGTTSDCLGSSTMDDVPRS